MINKVVHFIKEMLTGGRTPVKLAQASCVGIFIAFSPFIGFHWLMTIILAWVLRLNIGVMYAAAHIVNNPFTMIPLYLAGYAVGDFIAGWLGLNLLAYNPSWMNWLNIKLSCLGIPNLSLWTFIIGGNVLGFIVAIAAYPFVMRFYKRILVPPAE
jgi:uncharacterized protein (DUF2062 family)